MPDHAYGVWSLLPPLLAIGLSIVTRRVVVSLAAGVFVGAIMLSGGNLFAASVSVVSTHLWPSLINSQHPQVFAFTLLMGAMVGVVHRSGGMHGIVAKLVPLARSRRGGQLVTWLLGLVIFFDDYANTLLLGTTLQPLADRLRISREKLAYLVDSTAAPVAGLAIVSTWVAGEIGYIQEGLNQLPAAAATADALTVFVHCIAYRFYVLWALLFVPLVAWMRRDFGPMRTAELQAADNRGPQTVSDERATRDSARQADSVEPRHWLYAVGPIAVTVSVIVAYILWSGWRAARQDPSVPPSWINVVGSGDSYAALVYGSLAGLLVAVALAWAGGALSVRDVWLASLRGARWMLPALAILWLAWTLSRICDGEFLGTGNYLGGLLEQRVAPALLPTFVFLIASAVSFATGTSWGTMGILMPLVIPVTHRVLSAATDPAGVDHPVFLAAVGSVLAGAIFGDHCSPISDTTILSSQASGCHHMAHVRTQLPYALLVATVAIAAGTLPVGCGVSVWVLLPIGPALLFVFLRSFGGRT